MKLHRHIAVAGAILLAAISVAAQQKPGNLVGLEFQRPKPGMTTQYEAGRKAKAEWHAQQKDPQALLVWETLTGEDTGEYIVGRVGLHWADMDHPAIPEDANTAEYDKVLGDTVQSIVARYYEFMSAVSNPDMSTEFPNLEEIVIFHVREGHGEDFTSAVTRIHDGTVKTQWPLHYSWYHLVDGGPGGEYVLSFPRANWSDFAEDPNVKPFRDMLKEAFGQAEADSVVKRLNTSIENSRSEIIKFRQDLSYLPAK